VLPFIKGYSIAADSRTRIHCAAESIGAVPVGGSEDGICNPRTWAKALSFSTQIQVSTCSEGL
jgi:hypothetical protein